MAPAARWTSVSDAAEKAARPRGYPSGRLVIDASSDVPAPGVSSTCRCDLGEAERGAPHSARPWILTALRSDRDLALHVMRGEASSMSAHEGRC